MNDEVWNILLIEDDEEDYLLTQDVLEKMHSKGQRYRLVWARTYEDGLVQSCQPDFDIALVDYDLGMYNGVDLIHAAVEAGSPLAFVLFTGQGSYQVDMQAMQAGADDYLNKGELTPILLERSIRYALSHKRDVVTLANANESLAHANASLANANESLALANARLKASEERFELASQAVVGMLYDWDIRSGRIYRSDSIEQLIGRQSHEVGPSIDDWHSLVHPEDLQHIEPTVQTILNESQNKYETEYRVRHVDGHWVHVLDRGYILRQAGRAVRVVGTAHDISRQKQLEADLRSSEERFRIALSNAPVTVATIDRNLKYTWLYNPLLTPGINEVLGQGDEFFLPPDSVEILTAIKQRVLETEQGLSQEVSLNTHLGERTYILVLEPLRDPSGEVCGMTAAALDITEQREMERQQIRAAMQMEAQRHLLDQREMERQQIARDLHDGPIQEVVGLLFAVQEAVSINTQPELNGILEQLHDALQKLSGNLRGVCNELRPPLLMRFGLERAIRAHAEDFSARYRDTKIHLDLSSGLPDMSESTKLTMYRIFQEGLNNITRHSHATEVIVRLRLVRSQVQMELQDNGQGFRAPSDWVELARAGHLGLVGMRERAEAINGRLEVFTRPGHGTRIRVTAPPGGNSSSGA